MKNFRPKAALLLALILPVFFCLGRLAAQTIEPIEKPPSPEEELKKEAEEKSSAEDDWGAAAMPILAYNPELGGMFGAAGLLFRVPSKERAKPGREVSDPSTFTANAIYTSEKAFLAGINADASAINNMMKVQLGFNGEYLPTYYWGIGPEADEREAYIQRRYVFSTKTGMRIFRHFYGGPLYEYHIYALSDKKDEGGLETEDPEGSETVTLASGIGFRLFWDSTRGGFFPFDGMSAEFTGRLFREELGGSSNYGLITLDTRSYLTTFFSHVAALQILYQTSIGEPPIQMLPFLGGEETMRGYYQKRYRDKTAVSGRIEYRAPLTDRIGLVGFLSMGQVAESYGALSSNNIKTAGGGGLRVTLQKKLRLNLRVDIAISEDGVFPYIDVREVF